MRKISWHWHCRTLNTLENCILTSLRISFPQKSYSSAKKNWQRVAFQTVSESGSMHFETTQFWDLCVSRIAWIFGEGFVFFEVLSRFWTHLTQMSYLSELNWALPFPGFCNTRDHLKRRTHGTLQYCPQSCNLNSEKTTTNKQEQIPIRNTIPYSGLTLAPWFNLVAAKAMWGLSTMIAFEGDVLIINIIITTNTYQFR